MNETLERFLAESPLAGKIKLPARVVVRRTELSLCDVAGIREAGGVGAVPEREAVCELVVGGQRLAQGKLVRKKGEWYFKVSRVLEGEDNMEATI